MSHPLDPLVHKLGLHALLGVEECRVLRALPFDRRTLDPGVQLVRESEPSANCAVLLSGYAYRQKITHEGARQIVSLHLPGEAVDFQNLFLDVADHDVLTLTRAEVAIVSNDAIRTAVRGWPGIAHAILIYTLIEASMFREWVLNVGRRNARTRLAHLLCEFAVRIDAQGLKDGTSYELPMTQDQLADALGLTPVHVNRTLRVLEQDGIVIRSRRTVNFPSGQALRDVAGFCDRYLHLGQQRA